MVALIFAPIFEDILEENHLNPQYKNVVEAVGAHGLTLALEAGHSLQKALVRGAQELGALIIC